MKIKDRIAELPKGSGRPYGKRSLNVIDTIVIHHSATEPGKDNALAFARYHVETNGWPGIAYHYVIDPDGSIDKCQPITAISYHAAGVNTRSIGVCLVGDFDKHEPTKAQWDAVIELVKDLRKAMPRITRILGHREVPKTHKSCPGNKFDMDKLRRIIQ